MSKRLSPGDLLEEKYLIVRTIGEGGMGVVYEAEHLMLKRPCAIKVLHPTEADNQMMIARFKVEAQSAANIRHPNIVEVMDFGITPDGGPFFVMEFLSGESLSDRLKNNPVFPIRSIISIIDQILSGLSRAHKAGVIHRDLKPENILLTHDVDNREIVKILDFGISKIFDPREASKSIHTDGRPHTQQGVVLGTPGYMAPESVFGLADVDERADLFSVGVLMYEMSTGRRPFTGENILEILTATTTTVPQNPSIFRPDLSSALEKIILVALAKDPKDRFRSADDFLRYLTSAAVGRMPDSAPRLRTQASVPVAPKQQLQRPKPLPTRADSPLPAPGPTVGLSRGPTGSYIAQRGKENAAVPKRMGITRTEPLKPKLLNFGISPFAIAALLIVGVAVYYFFIRNKPVVIVEEKDELGEKMAQIERRAGASSGASAGEDVDNQSQDISQTVTIWLDAAPHNVAVLWDGVPSIDRPLVVRSAKVPVTAVFTAPGYVEEKVKIVPNRDQTLRIVLKKK